MEIGKQIKKCRSELGISQDQLAERIFVSRQSISNWENDKNYPDIKSLVLLSHLFNISLDTLIKGDVNTMKKEITLATENNNMDRFKRNTNIFTVLFIASLVLPIPLFRFLGYSGIAIWILIAISAFYYSLRVEKDKKKLDIQTYKEILAFTEGRALSDIEKERETGKRNYQKLFLAIASGILAIILTIIMLYLLY